MMTPSQRWPSRRTGCSILVLFATLAVPASARAQPQKADLTRLSLEDLMNIEITSASHKEQRVLDVASAVFVITQDDIRRSGMTSIPGLLRMVPGVNVAQINSNKWAVSVRGFNGLFANTLLVLVDGRSVYNRLYSGVFWDTMDLMLDDVERIEVIRGPGASAWGANAVNGVINIITKSAADSQRTLVRVDVGRNGTQAALRHGGTAFNTPYRVFAQWTGRDEYLLASGASANDSSHSVTTGIRADRLTGRGTLTLEGAFTAGRTRPRWINLNAATAAGEPFLSDSTEILGGHVRGRWAYTAPGGLQMHMQSSIDLADRREALGTFTRRAFDLDGHGRKTMSARHDLVAGVGFRRVGEQLDGLNGVALTPPEDHSNLVTAFVQDDISLATQRVRLILGAQFQHDSRSGAGWQPTVRVMWNVRPRQRLWAAASRALRTPSLSDRGVRVDYPPVPIPGAPPLVVTLFGNPDVDSETFSDIEAGYRIELGSTASIDATAFVGRYRDLITPEVAPPVLLFNPAQVLQVISTMRNQSSATTRGLEVAGHWTPVSTVTFDGSLALLNVRTKAGTAASVEADGPRTQWQVRSVFTPVLRATLTASLFHVGRLVTAGVDPYTRADVTAEWRISDRLALMAIGQNILDASHAEFSGTTALLMSTEIPRNISARLRWTF
jgi:iron complex outermembrane receptor protein